MSAEKESRRTAILIWAAASAVLMALGAIGPWVNALGSSVSGIDGSNDGWIVLIASLLGALGMYATRTNRGAGLLALLAGAIGSVVTIHDRTHINHLLSNDSALTQVLVHVGWGLNLAMIASVSFAIVGAAWLLTVESQAPDTPLATNDR